MEEDLDGGSVNSDFILRVFNESGEQINGFEMIRNTTEQKVLSDAKDKYPKGVRYEADNIGTLSWKTGGRVEATKKVRELMGTDDYTKFVKSLGKLADDPKIMTVLSSGLFDGKRKDEAFGMKVKTVPVKDLVPTQNEIDVDKSLSLSLSAKFPETLQSMLKGKDVEIVAPIVVLNDKFILDGHHRWSQIYALNKDAKAKVLSFYGDIDPVEMLKVLQIAIAIELGEVPTAVVKGKNLLKVNDRETKKAILDNLSDKAIQMMVDEGKIDAFDKNQAVDYVMDNIKSMRKTSQPIEGAPSRAVMPQTTEADYTIPNTKEGVINYMKPFKSGGEVESFIDYWESQPDDEIVVLLYESHVPALHSVIRTDKSVIENDDNTFEVADVVYKPGKTREDLLDIVRIWDTEFKSGGEVSNIPTDIDLFEHYDLHPPELSNLIEEFQSEYIDGADYNDLDKVREEFEKIGFTFDYGLDAEPYNLRKIGTRGSEEYYKTGGKVNKLTESMSKKNQSTKVDSLYKKALALHNAYVANEGNLSYSDKDYGYLSDDLDYVEVGWYKNAPDGSLQEELDQDNFKMTEDDAITTLSHRIESIYEDLTPEQIKEFESSYKDGKLYKRGGTASSRKNDYRHMSDEKHEIQYAISKGLKSRPGYKGKNKRIENYLLRGGDVGMAMTVKEQRDMAVRRLIAMQMMLFELQEGAIDPDKAIPTLIKLSDLSDPEPETWAMEIEEFKKGGKVRHNQKLDMLYKSREKWEKNRKTPAKKHPRQKMSKGGRIESMVESWNENGFANSNLNNDDAEFFERIGKSSFEVPNTSFTGMDIRYYDPERVEVSVGGFRPKK